jgi:hypothetical protein
MAYLIESVFSMWELSPKTQARPNKNFPQAKKHHLIGIIAVSTKAGDSNKKATTQLNREWLFD